MKMATNYFAIRRMEIESLLQKEQEMNRYKADLNRMYRQMDNDVQVELDRYLVRFEESVSNVDLDDYQEHLRRFEMEDMSNAGLPHSRLELTQKRIETITASSAEEEIRRLTLQIEEEYREEYLRRLEQMSGTIDMSTSPAQLKRLAIAAVKQRHHGRHFSSRVWESQKEMQAELDNIIRRAISLGENPVENAPRLKRFVKESVNKKAYAARRLAHTETQNVQFTASNQMFRDYFEEDASYDWLAEDDEATCEICGELGSGGPYTLNELDSIGTPHPNCRCSYTISSSYLKELRKARGLERGDHD